MKGKSSGGDFIYNGEEGCQLVVDNTYIFFIINVCLFPVGRNVCTRTLYLLIIFQNQVFLK